MCGSASDSAGDFQRQDNNGAKHRPVGIILVLIYSTGFAGGEMRASIGIVAESPGEGPQEEGGRAA